MRLSCELAPCSGSAEVMGPVSGTSHKAGRTVTTRETAVLAKARYSVAMGNTKVVRLKQTAVGTAVFAAANDRTLREELVVTVRGGTELTKVLLIS